MCVSALKPLGGQLAELERDPRFLVFRWYLQQKLGWRAEAGAGLKMPREIDALRPAGPSVAVRANGVAFGVHQPWQRVAEAGRWRVGVERDQDHRVLTRVAFHQVDDESLPIDHALGVVRLVHRV